MGQSEWVDLGAVEELRGVLLKICPGLHLALFHHADGSLRPTRPGL